MTVSAVVISHEQPRDLERCVQLLGEVDEIVAVANTPTSAARLLPM